MIFSINYSGKLCISNLEKIKFFYKKLLVSPLT